MSEKIIRSHAKRVKQAKDLLANNPRYSRERISRWDREAFVEFFLLEDIVRLYEIRLNDEKAHEVVGERVSAFGTRSNIEKFSAIIMVFKAAVEAARTAINGGEYTKVWKAIHEYQLIDASKSIKNLAEMRRMAVDMLRELSGDAMAAAEERTALEEDMDDLEAHEANLRKVRGIPLTPESIEEVIKNAEEAIPDRNKKSRLNVNSKL